MDQPVAHKLLKVILKIFHDEKYLFVSKYFLLPRQMQTLNFLTEFINFYAIIV